MYNRYIPQNDGTYRRSRISDPPRQEPAAQRLPESRPPEPMVPDCDCPQSCHRNTPPPPPPRPKGEPQSIGSFLRQLIPAGFDTEDLLIVLLLLLMAGDCREDQNTAILTLFLYLFL